MKKIYALFAGLLIAGAVTAQRNIDLNLALTTPVDGSTVARNASQSIIFTIGSTAATAGDTLVDGDTLVLYYYNLTTTKTYSMIGQTEGSVNILPLTGQLAPIIGILNGGGTISSTQLQQGGLTLNTTAAGFNVNDQIMVVVDFYGKNGEEESQANFADNAGQFKLGAPVAVNNVNKFEMVAFPNPATTVLTINSPEEITSISVLSLDGKVVTTSNSNTVNVASLTTGVYLYQVTTVNGLVSTAKFIKE